MQRDQTGNTEECFTLEEEVNVKRNDPCPCGSGKKYKKCCVEKALLSDDKLSEEALTIALNMEKAGNLPGAKLRYERIVASDPGNAQAQLRLGNLLSRQGSFGLATKHSLTAYSLTPKSEATAIDCILNLLTAGQAAKALEVVNRCLKFHPKSINLLILKGQILERLNQLEESINILTYAKRLAPHQEEISIPLARSYRHLKKYSQAESILEESISTLSTVDYWMNETWNELGHVKDKLGKYDEAFSAFTKSGEILAQSPAARKINANQVDLDINLLTHWINGGGLARINRSYSGQRCTSPDLKHIFFVGFPRSGTTMTEQIMSSHSQISSSEEKPFIDESIRVIQSACRNQNLTLEALEQCSEETLSQAEKAYWTEAEKYFDSGAQVFIDKLPLNIINLAMINILFPQSKVIVALRDPRDVCLSCFFQFFGLNSSMVKFLSWESTVDFYNRAMSYWLVLKKHISLPWIEIKYEDTVSDLEAQARIMIEYIGVNWEDAVLSHHKKNEDKYVATPSYQAIREPVHKRATQRWKNYPVPVNSALPKLQKLMDAFGYVD